MLARVFRFVCKLTAYAVISALCVGFVYLVYWYIKNDPFTFFGVLGIGLLLIFAICGFFYIDEDTKKQLKKSNEQINQIAEEVKQYSAEVCKFEEKYK